jgi:hypothetical protein
MADRLEREEDASRKLAKTFEILKEQARYGRESPLVWIGKFKVGSHEYHLTFVRDSSGNLELDNIHLTQERAGFHLYFRASFDEDGFLQVRFVQKASIPGKKGKPRSESSSDVEQLGFLKEPTRLLIQGILLALQTAGG